MQYSQIGVGPILLDQVFIISVFPNVHVCICCCFRTSDQIDGVMNPRNGNVSSLRRTTSMKRQRNVRVSQERPEFLDMKLRKIFFFKCVHE